VFTQERKIPVKEIPVPVTSGDTDSILPKIQMVKYHLTLSVSHIESIASYISSLPKPLSRSAISSLDNLISTGEALFDS